MNSRFKPRLTWNHVTQMWMVQVDRHGHALQAWMQQKFQPLADSLNRLNDKKA